MITIIRFLQLIWSIFLFVILLVGFLSFQTAPVVWALLFLFVYFCASFFAFFVTNRLAWLIAIIVPFYLLRLYGPIVILNVYLGYINRGLFGDSPGTLIMMQVYFLLIVIPSAILCLLYLFCIKKVWKLFRCGKYYQLALTGLEKSRKTELLKRSPYI